MPARQRGQVYKRGPTWAARYYDETGKRIFRGGFATKSDAGEWLDRKVAEVEALRRGERVAPSDIPTVSEWVDTYLATHEVDPATTDKLRYQLAHATRAFGEKRLDQLRTPDFQVWRSESSSPLQTSTLLCLQDRSGAGRNAGVPLQQPDSAHQEPTGQAR